MDELASTSLYSGELKTFLYLIHPVPGDGGNGDNLNADQTAVPHREHVRVTAPVQGVHVETVLSYLSHRPELL